jgi:hypothetical protein
MDVSGNSHAWPHFQDMDHCLPNFLVLTLLFVAQDPGKLWLLVDPWAQGMKPPVRRTLERDLEA